MAVGIYELRDLMEMSVYGRIGQGLNFNTLFILFHLIFIWSQQLHIIIEFDLQKIYPQPQVQGTFFDRERKNCANNSARGETRQIRDLSTIYTTTTTLQWGHLGLAELGVGGLCAYFIFTAV